MLSRKRFDEGLYRRHPLLYLWEVEAVSRRNLFPRQRMQGGILPLSFWNGGEQRDFDFSTVVPPNS